jgi:DNA-binding NtrC family response regulator
MTKKILFMDDDRAIRKLIGGYFEDLGYQVFLAEDGKLGLEVYHKQHPDIVLIDLRMPRVDGFEALSTLHELAPDLPLLVISGEGEMADVIQALRLGAWNYHTKPIESLDIIRHSVEQALHKASLLQENKCYQRGLEHKLSTIIENFPGFIYTVDAHRRITYMNQPLIDYVGKNAVGQSCHQTIWGLAEMCAWCPMHHDIPEKVGKVEIQSPKDSRWFHLIYFPIQNKDNQICEVQGIVYDITERKQAQLNMEEREAYLRKENLRLRNTLTDRYKFGNIIGKSRAMQEVYETIINAAASDAAVIIYGESGTGKELVAQAIHECSDRKDQQLVYVNCGAIPENLIESEFFGYRKGAFSGAVQDKHGFLDIADNGTIFLDEVGEISLNMQVKLLRAIEGNGYTPVGDTTVKHPNVRIIAATNRDLKQLVREGAMRQDFLYRIHIIPIQLPPLRERKGDIGLLVEHFLGRYEQEKVPPLTPHHTRGLENYDWPGNVRELENTLHRYVTLGKLDFMGQEYTIAGSPEPLFEIDTLKDDLSLAQMLEEVEKTILLKAFEKHHYHQGKTAQTLKVDRKTLYRKMKYLGIEKPS